MFQRETGHPRQPTATERRSPMWAGVTGVHPETPGVTPAIFDSERAFSGRKPEQEGFWK